MPSELLTVDVHNIPEATAWTVGMLERAQDMTPVWEAGHRAFMLEMREQFTTEGQHLTQAEWTPLSPKYKEWKERHYPGAPILQRTGALLASLTEPGNAAHVALITPDRAIFGSDVEYGPHHQKGGAKLPQRKIIQMRDVFKRLVFRASIAWIVGGRQLRDVTGDGGE